ncbi:MAG: ATP-dependent helicase HrpB, partial [Myxococcales bacterium]|nr:ATP-dependent helicase HrpB [Myxococcales bacterium]
RTRPGRCLRLYTRVDLEGRPEHDAPEIRRLDLAQTRLELAALGGGDLPWFEAPPEPNVRAADDLLRRLGALDPAGLLTATGRAMLRFAVHPRLARVVVEGERRGVADDACVAAALLGERDIRQAQRATFGGPAVRDAPSDRSDVEALLDLFREAEDSRFSAGALRAAGLDAGATHAVAKAAAELERARRRAPAAQPDGTGRSEIISKLTIVQKPVAAAVPRMSEGASPEAALGIALLAGYPDRVARRVAPGANRIALAAGGLAELGPSSVVRDAEWMVALDVEDRGGESQGERGARPGRTVVRLASAIEPEWLIDLFPDEVEERREVRWNAQAERVDARDVLAWQSLVLEDGGGGAGGHREPSPEEATPVLVEAALRAGARAFAPEGVLDRWLARARFAASADSSFRPLDDETVRATLTELCAGHRSFAELREAGLLAALRAKLGRSQADLDRAAPDRVTLAGGRSVPVQYEVGKPPSIASRLQDFFGTKEGPRVAGRVPLVLELLAPNGRAVQVTSDLAGFWQRHYPAIRKELMRKYPKHSWPEDPVRASPPARR